ncbi:MAG: hypothetical protein K2P38_17955 [Lachnospiraceae bacterium]|nr:hypothetical protein [Lachnospiraceae bacterium]
MVDKEMLTAMEGLLDRKLEPVNGKLDRLEIFVDERMTGLEASVSGLDERMSSLEASVSRLDERMSSLEASVSRLDERTSNLEASVKEIENRTLELELDVKEIKVKYLENNILPRLNTIEAYYTGTLKMYRNKAELIDKMGMDVSNLNITVENHSKVLRTVAAMAP